MLKFAAAVSAALIAGVACAQTPAPAASGGPPPPPCSTPEYRQLDFWVGDWELTFPAGNGQTGKASNRISKDEYGSCVITEHFTQPNGFKATSVSIYDRQRGVWRQTWVDNGGGVFVLEGGPVTGQPHVFEFHTVEPRGPQKLMMRMIWENLTANGLVWRWQSQQPDGSWKDQWVLNYKRKG
jgi:hypothetical protein